jgi:DNA polymerase-3 subunit epsilon
MPKYCFLDSETGGTDPKRHALLQVAGIIVTNDQEVASFNFHIQPFPTDVVEDSALAINGIKREELSGYEDPKKVHDMLVGALGIHVDKFDKHDKYVFTGYKAQFDYDFLRAFFEKCGDQYFGSFFWNPALDIMTLAYSKLLSRRPMMPNFKLGTVAAEFSLKPEGTLHDALADIRLTKQLFDKLK